MMRAPQRRGLVPAGGDDLTVQAYDGPVARVPTPKVTPTSTSFRPPVSLRPVPTGPMLTPDAIGEQAGGPQQRMGRPKVPIQAGGQPAPRPAVPPTAPRPVPRPAAPQAQAQPAPQQPAAPSPAPEAPATAPHPMSPPLAAPQPAAQGQQLQQAAAVTPQQPMLRPVPLAPVATVQAPPAAAPAPVPQMPAPISPAGSGASPVAPLSLTPVSGAETPYHVNPTSSPQLDALQTALAGEAQRELAQPTVYDDALYQQAKASGARGIEENYDQSLSALNSQLASRGLDYSSVAGKGYTDLGNRRAAALSDLDTNILQQRAQALAAGRAGAVNTASGVAGMLDQTGRADRAEQRGERAYSDALRTQARDEGIQDYLTEVGLNRQQGLDQQALIDAALRYGTLGTGAQALQGAGSLYDVGAGAYGGLADAGDANLAQLAQLALQYFGGGQ